MRDPTAGIRRSTLVRGDHTNGSRPEAGILDDSLAMLCRVLSSDSLPTTPSSSPLSRTINISALSLVSRPRRSRMLLDDPRLSFSTWLSKRASMKISTKRRARMVCEDQLVVVRKAPRFPKPPALWNQLSMMDAVMVQIVPIMREQRHKREMRQLFCPSAFTTLKS